MPHDLTLILGLALPALVIVFLRLNGAMMFLSLCLGSILVQYVGSSTNDFLDLISPAAGKFSKDTVDLALLLAPAVITGIVTIWSTRGRIRVVLNVLPAVATSSLAAVLAIPLLSPQLAASIERGSLWHIISHAESIIVSGGAVISLLALWTQRSNFKGHDEAKHKH